MTSIRNLLQTGARDGDLRPQDQANANRFTAWCLAAAVCYVLSILAFEMHWLLPGPSGLLIALLFTIPALGAVRAYSRFLREADEMTRQINMQSLAYGFGAGVVFAMGWRLLERAGAPELDVSDSVVVSMLSWSLAHILISRKYR